MSTPNFSKYNTKNYCVLLDENHCDDYEFMMDDLGYCAEDKGFDRTSDYNRSMKMSIFAERENYENRFSTELTEIELTAQLGVIGGYYADATIDFDSEVTPTCSGYKYRLSDYDDIFSMVQDILADMDGDAEYYAKYGMGWNKGIWKMNKKHVQTWLIDLITKEYDRCNEFCENNCDNRLMCVGVFSNGEAVYRQAN